MASRFKCPWTAVHVKNEALNAAQQAALAKHKQLAVDLGATVEEVALDDVADALAEYVSKMRATQLIVGHSQRSRWHELLHGSVVQRLLRRLPDVDVHVVAERPER